jgi:hypothetical protein
MALKLASVLTDKRQRALIAARFKAWWNGEAFDAEAAAVAVEAALAAEEEAETAGEKAPKAKTEKQRKGKPKKPTKAEAAELAGEADLFGEAAAGEELRLSALQRIWGKGRIMPGDVAGEALHVARLGLPATGSLGVFGPGLVAPVAGLAETHLGPIAVLEWRAETAPALAATLGRHKAAKRLAVTTIDLDLVQAPSAPWDGLISFDEFTYVDNPSRLAQTFAKAIAAKGVAVVECYCALPGGDYAPAFASAFAEPQLRPSGDLADMLDAAGFRVDAAEDVTEEHLTLAREGFRRLAETLKSASDLAATEARELAWEAEAWRERVRLLGARRIERRLFTLTRRA